MTNAGVGWRRWAKEAEPSAPAPAASDFEFTSAGEWLRIPFYLGLALAGPYLVPEHPEARLLFAIYALGILAGFAFQLAPRRGWARELAAAATVVLILLAACGWSLGLDFLEALRAGGPPEELWRAASQRLYTLLEFPEDPQEFVHLPVLVVAMFGAELVIREGVSPRGGESPLWGLAIPAFALQVGWFALLPGQASAAEWGGVVVSSAIFASLGLVAGVLGGVLVAAIFHGVAQRLRR